MSYLPLFNYTLEMCSYKILETFSTSMYDLSLKREKIMLFQCRANNPPHLPGFSSEGSVYNP
jgi:hypothetical protein